MLVRRVIASLVCGTLAISCLPGVAQAQWGSIRGKIVLDGDVPTLKDLVKKGDAAAKDAAVCAKDGVPDESLIVDPTSKGIANVVLYLRQKPAKIHPDRVAKRDTQVIYDAVGCRYVPHITIVQAGQLVVMRTADAVAHNPRANPLKNQGPGFIIAPNDRAGIPMRLQFGELLPVPVGCDIHPWMRGWWVVVDHPYAAVTAADGTFEIKDLPVGENEFRVWHERRGYVEKSLKVTVKAGATVDVPTIKVPVKTLLDVK